MSAPARPYRSALAAAIGSALAAGVIAASLDIALTLAGATAVKSADTLAFAKVVYGVYLPLALLIGAVEGVVAGAIAATHPDGSITRLWRRLRTDAAFDRTAAGVVLAGAGAALIYALVIAVLSLGLVAGVERKSVGALLAGLVAVAALPVVALAGYPIFRVTRRIAARTPRSERLPATVLLVGGLLAAGVAVALLIMITRLDFGAINLGAPLMFGALLLAQAGTLALARERLAARGTLVAVAAAVALLAPMITLRGTPTPRALALLSVESRGARTLVAAVRSASDRDHDGYATLLGGGDCNDHDKSINPDAKDRPGNGVDENCNGVDSPAKAPPVPAGGDAGTTPAPAAFAWKGNVVVIAVDTLRADKLGVAGYRRGGKSLTPNIDALAARGVNFTRVYAQAPHTPRSFPSMFTSRYPSAIHWTNSFANYPKLEPDNVTLWEALQAGGVHTVGESSHFYFTGEFGITQGFDEYDNEGATNLKDSNTDIASPRIVARVKPKLAELAAGKQRFALFVHLFEPHSTYVTHEGVSYVETGKALFEEKYDREVEFVDGAVGQVVAAVDAAGLSQDTMIVLVSDHGEGFFVHSYGGQKLGWHGQSLYDEVLRVPMIVAAPGLAPHAVDQPVMLIDLAPTLCDVLGVALPPQFQGRSLAAALVGQPLAPHPAYAELLRYPNFDVSMKAMISGDGKQKIIHNLTDRAYELFDLASDARELQNLAYDHPDQAKPMQDALEAWVDSELSQ